MNLKTKITLEKEQLELSKQLKDLEQGTDEYDLTLAGIQELDSLLGRKEPRGGFGGWISKLNINTLVNAGVSIFTVLCIIGYEKTDVITSKAFGYIKPKKED